MSNARSSPSSPVGGPPRVPKSTAIIKGETIDEVARHTIRWTSLIVIGVSFLGAIFAFNGTSPQSWRVWENLSPLAIIGGIVLQAFCTLMEWANRKRRLSPQYIGPLMLDVGSTYVGFAPLIIPGFVRGLTSAGLPLNITLIIAHLGVTMLALWFAYYPEQTLVDD